MNKQLLNNTGDMALKRRAIYILGNLELKTGNKILEVGCGDGYYLHLLSNLGMNIKLNGTDFDREALKKAKLNISKKIPLKFGDLMKKLPYKPNTFDRVVMSEVAEHLPDDTKGLKEVKRVLKRGGILCLTVPNQNYPFLWDPVNWILEHVFNTHVGNGFWAGIWNQHVRLYTPKQIRKVVEKAGFKIIEEKSLTFWCLPFNHYIVNIVARLLVHGHLSKQNKAALSKYSVNPKRPLILDVAFKFVNLIDSLNDIWQPENSGVSIFIKAIKDSA